MSTPAIRGIAAPVAAPYFWRCLCLVLLQITRTVPLRRTILQFSQMRLTLVLTFMSIALPAKMFRKVKTRIVAQALLTIKRHGHRSTAAHATLPMPLIVAEKSSHQSPVGATVGEDFAPGVGHGDGMLEVGGRLAVFGYHRPLILEQDHLAAAHDHHGLD